MTTTLMLRTALCAITVAGFCVVAESPVATADPPAPACKSGFVWRAARPGDAVCVTPEIRDKTAQQNAAAAQNVQPGGGNTCKSGFVWRNAYPGDAVCVTPDVRDQATADNQAAASRTVANSGTCQKWRGVTDEVILAEDNGYKVFAYTSLTGQASFEGHGGPEVKGAITTPGGIKGNAISFNVNWSNGWHSRYAALSIPTAAQPAATRTSGRPTTRISIVATGPQWPSSSATSDHLMSLGGGGNGPQ